MQGSVGFARFCVEELPVQKPHASVYAGQARFREKLKSKTVAPQPSHLGLHLRSCHRGTYRSFLMCMWSTAYQTLSGALSVTDALCHTQAALREHDLILTVSPGYALEICSDAAMGCGMQDILNRRGVR